MNPRLAGLHRYPFEKLADLLKGVAAPNDRSAISWAIGEPKHAAPPFVLEEIQAHLTSLSAYPSTRGQPVLREAIAAWANRRFHLARAPLDPERHVLPVSGTREALFSLVQAVIDTEKHARPVVIMPNPFYQIYEGAALLAGAEPYYVNTLPAEGYRMDLAHVPASILARTQLVFVCSPSNPTGAVAQHKAFAEWIALADRHDFVIASDECYSELYFDEEAPPPGILQVAAELGIKDYRRCFAFHSLSKRSSLPGLRSGFVAGDGTLLADYLRYRTYHGAALPLYVQAASAKAWGDEAHVRANRELYRRKFDAVLDILQPVLDVQRPDASFYLWPRTPIDDQVFARELYRRENVLVLPGSYLSREAEGTNPGCNRVRMALVAPLAECVEAAQRVRRFIESL